MSAPSPEARRLAEMELRAKEHFTFLSHKEVKLLARAYLDRLAEVRELQEQAEKDGDAIEWANKRIRELQEALRDVTAYSVLQHSGKYAVDADVMEKLFALAASSEEPGRVEQP